MNCEWLSLRVLSIIFGPMLRKKIVQITDWEKWPFSMLYFPISFVWVWYMIRSRAFWFFTSSNPTIEFGGFEGEGKKEMYLQLPPETVPQTIFIKHSLPFSEVLNAIRSAGFAYPFIVKPDVGMSGILFRKIDNEEQLLHYHEKMPAEYIVQELVELPVEVSVFYYRHPKSTKGIVSGFLLKELLHVKGDGISSLSRLIEEHPRAKFRLDEMKRKHGQRFDQILEKDEIFYLSYAANFNRGATLTNLKHEIDESLLNVFDAIGKHARHFYYGRYDIKAASIEDLKAGRNFKILEYNGSGALPIHIFNCNMRLIDAYREILRHWKALFEISAYNNKNGFPYWSFKKGYRFLKASNRHFKMLRKCE